MTPREETPESREFTMAIEFICPSCQGTLHVPDQSAGNVVRCGNCMATLRVPEAAASTPVVQREEPAADRPPRRADLPQRSRPEPDRSSFDDRDDYGEPRPRRRGTKKSGGRSMLFWLVIVCGALALCVCLACGGLTLVLATPRWHEHVSPNGGFRVELPAQIAPNIAQQAKKELKPNEFVEGAMLIGRLEAYWVWYTEIDPRDRQNMTDEKLLDLAVQGLIKESNGTVFSDKKKTIEGGFPAREIVLTIHDDEALHCLAVVANSRIYIAAAGGPFVGSEGNERIRHFLDSFRIITPPGDNPWRVRNKGPGK